VALLVAVRRELLFARENVVPHSARASRGRTGHRFERRYAGSGLLNDITELSVKAMTSKAPVDYGTGPTGNAFLNALHANAWLDMFFARSDSDTAIHNAQVVCHRLDDQADSYPGSRTERYLVSRQVAEKLGSRCGWRRRNDRTGGTEAARDPRAARTAGSRVAPLGGSVRE
jgi:hypothetical protein